MKTPLIHYKVLNKKELTSSEKLQVFHLWNSEYPTELNYQSIEGLDRYLLLLSDKSHFILETDDGNLIGWSMTFTRNSEINFAMIISSHFQGKGYGSVLLNILKDHHVSLNGWTVRSNQYVKGDGSPYIAPVAFYKRNNFQIRSEIQMKNAPIEAIKITWIKS